MSMHMSMQSPTHIAVHVNNYLKQGKAGYFQQLHAKVMF